MRATDDCLMLHVVCPPGKYREEELRANRRTEMDVNDFSRRYRLTRRSFFISQAISGIALPNGYMRYKRQLLAAQEAQLS